MRSLFLALTFLIPAACLAKDRPLEVYFVDVEGGQATLIVSPSGESLLIDTGWPGFGGRDADRIVATARAAGLRRIDYVLITHYHEDHVGGVPQLAERIPIGTFIDHGPSAETDSKTNALVAAYNDAVAKARHLVVKPGDKIPIRGIDIEVVTAGGEAIRSPLSGAGQANPRCSDPTPKLEDTGENARSIGVLIRYGKFRMIDLGDLTWDKERDLACPRNLVGPVSVYLSTAHAHPGFGQAAMVHSLAPRVAIMNNGASKGGFADSLQTIFTAPGLEDVWQLHYATDAPVNLNAPHDWIANLEEKCEGYSISLTAASDGSFSVRNARNGFAERYSPRK